MLIILLIDTDNLHNFFITVKSVKKTSKKSLVVRNNDGNTLILTTHCTGKTQTRGRGSHVLLSDKAVEV